MTKGKTGAKRQSWEGATPRSILVEISEANSGLNREALFKLFEEEVLNHPNKDNLIQIIMIYWFNNNYNSLKDDRFDKPVKLRIVDPEEIRRHAELVVEKVVEEKVKKLLLELPMPNGKRLRECTGKDCRAMGSWMGKIGERIKPTDIVGQVLSEAEVRKISGRKIVWLDE